MASLVRMDEETADMVNETIAKDSANLPTPGELWADFLMMQAKWHQARGSLAVAWNHMGRATRALGSHATPPMKLKSSLLRAQLMWDRGQLKEALPLLDGVVTGAHRQGLARILCEGEALRFATQCNLGMEPDACRDFSGLLEEDALLRVSANYYLSRGEEARGQKDKALAHWRRAHDEAERCGYLHWTQRLAKRSPKA